VNFLQGVSFSQTNSIGGNNTSAPINGRNHSIFLEYARRINLQDEYLNFADFLGGSHDVTYSESKLRRLYIGGVTAERNILPPLFLFIKTWPIN
jgi:hypothetical protein